VDVADNDASASEKKVKVHTTQLPRAAEVERQLKAAAGCAEHFEALGLWPNQINGA
jgi:hypothetical protein